MNGAAVQSDTHMPTEIFQTSSAYRQPLHNCKLPTANSKNLLASSSANTKQPVKATWQHDPHAPGAIILNQQQWSNAEAKGSSQVLPVVIDPFIAKKLRPHQHQGVQFLYECIMGLREANRCVACF